MTTVLTDKKLDYRIHMFAGDTLSVGYTNSSGTRIFCTAPITSDQVIDRVIISDMWGDENFQSGYSIVLGKSK